MAAYAASKGGIESFTHTLALEYAKQGLRAVAVAPGGIMTGMSEATPGLLPADADWDLFAKMMPALGTGNMASPDAVGNMIAALASDDGFYVTGATLRIDGGAHG
jgi:NAD(P)-dependent dehydrogenase (short-subunit alcohol dehydrogenase family)